MFPILLVVFMRLGNIRISGGGMSDSTLGWLSEFWHLHAGYRQWIVHIFGWYSYSCELACLLIGQSIWISGSSNIQGAMLSVACLLIGPPIHKVLIVGGETKKFTTDSEWTAVKRLYLDRVTETKTRQPVWPAWRVYRQYLSEDWQIASNALGPQHGKFTNQCSGWKDGAEEVLRISGLPLKTRYNVRFIATEGRVGELEYELTT